MTVNRIAKRGRLFPLTERHMNCVAFSLRENAKRMSCCGGKKKEKKKEE